MTFILAVRLIQEAKPSKKTEQWMSVHDTTS